MTSNSTKILIVSKACKEHEGGATTALICGEMRNEIQVGRCDLIYADL